MPTVKQLLRFADPVRHEPPPDAWQRERLRQSVIAAAATNAVAPPWFRAPLAVAALAAVIVAGIFAVSLRNPRGSGTVYAAVRFEVRLAETQPAAGLSAARVSGSDRVVYLHDEDVLVLDGLHTTVADGDTLVILPAMAGGARPTASRRA